MDQGSTMKRSAVHNFAPIVTKFCVMWEGQALPHDTKFGNSRCEIVGRRVIFIWSLIHGLRWSGLIKAEPGLLFPLGDCNIDGVQSDKSNRNDSLCYYDIHEWPLNLMNMDWICWCTWTRACFLFAIQDSPNWRIIMDQMAFIWRDVACNISHWLNSSHMTKGIILMYINHV